MSRDKIREIRGGTRFAPIPVEMSCGCGSNARSQPIEPMDIQKRITGDSWELLLAGRVDGMAANQLEVEILAAIRQNAKGIYVNLAQATFLCSAGIRVLLQYHRQMKNKGGLLLATRPSPEVASTLTMTGFPELVEK
jgi:anti-anti-sigma factor